MQRSNNLIVFSFIAVGLLAVFVGMLVGIGGGIPAIALVLLIGTVWMLLKDFRIGAATLMLLMPIAATTVMPRQMFGLTGANPFNLILLATLFSLALAMVFGRAKLVAVPWRLYWPLVLLLAIGTFIGSSKLKFITPHFYIDQPSLYHTALEYARDEFVKPLLTLTAVWLFAYSVSRSKNPDKWLVLMGAAVIALPMLIVAAVLHSGLGLRQLASPSARTVISVTGLHANAFSVMLLPAFAAALFMFPTLKSFSKRLFGAVVVAATLMALLLTFSRAAFLGVVLVTVIFFFLRGNFRYIIFGVFFFGVIGAVLPEAFVERATTGLSSGGKVGGRNDSLTAGRVGGIWMPLIPEILKHPVVGDGINATMWSLPSRQGVFVEGHPHNAYLRLLLDHGLIGVPLIFMFLYQIWTLYKRLSKDPRCSPTVRAFFQGVRIAFMIFFVQCMSGSNLIFEAPHVFYWFAAAFGLGLEYWFKTRSQPDPASNQTLVTAN